MDAILQQIADWLKEMLVDGIMNNLSGMFDAVNEHPFEPLRNLFENRVQKALPPVS